MNEYLRAFIPTCEAFGWEGGPRFNTRIVTKANGRERRNADWSQPQHAFSVPFQNILRQSDYAPIKRMHLNRKGAWGVFLFRDRLDDTANNDIFAVAEAGQTEFQLAKYSIIEGVEYRRIVDAIYTPNDDGSASESDITITVDDVPTTSFTLDHDTGIVTFDSPMSGGELLAWSGQFSLWVRFTRDDLPFSIDNRSGGEFVVNGSVDLLQMPAPEYPIDSSSSS